MRSRDQLRLGMIAEVRGAAIGNDAAGTPASVAISIVFASDLLGPLTAIDCAANRLVALGPTIDIGAITVFDDVEPRRRAGRARNGRRDRGRRAV